MRYELMFFFILDNLCINLSILRGECYIYYMYVRICKYVYSNMTKMKGKMRFTPYIGHQGIRGGNLSIVENHHLHCICFYLVNFLKIQFDRVYEKFNYELCLWVKRTQNVCSKGETELNWWSSRADTLLSRICYWLLPGDISAIVLSICRQPVVPYLYHSLCLNYVCKKK